MTVVLVNSSSNSIQAQLNSPAAPMGIARWQTFTSSNGNLWQSWTNNATNGSVTITIPGYGAVTLHGMAPPRLSVVPSPGNQVALSWPASAIGYSLQFSSNLASPWTAVTNDAVTSNGIITVTVAANAGARFYRLMQP